MPSIFTRIINGEIPSYRVAEDERFFAFLDINPNTRGHTLCVPKREVNKLFELDPDIYTGLMEFSRKVAIALEKSVPCKRIGMSVIGLEVPHVHVHLIPINEMRDMSFTSKVQVSPEDMAELAASIRANVNS